MSTRHKGEGEAAARIGLGIGWVRLTLPWWRNGPRKQDAVVSPRDGGLSEEVRHRAGDFSSWPRVAFACCGLLLPFA